MAAVQEKSRPPKPSAPPHRLTPTPPRHGAEARHERSAAQPARRGQSPPPRARLFCLGFRPKRGALPPLRRCGRCSPRHQDRPPRSGRRRWRKSWRQSCLQGRKAPAVDRSLVNVSGPVDHWAKQRAKSPKRAHKKDDPRQGGEEARVVVYQPRGVGLMHSRHGRVEPTIHMTCRTGASVHACDFRNTSCECAASDRCLDLPFSPGSRARATEHTVAENARIHRPETDARPGPRRASAAASRGAGPPRSNGVFPEFD